MTPASPAADPPAPRRRKRPVGEVLASLRQPKVAVMAALGFSSGLPFMLIGNTFNYWLGDAHVDLAVVGFASWVGLSLSFKFVFGAVADNVPLPLLGRLGRRRGWMLVAQAMVLCGLAGMALNDPAHRLAACVAFAVLASSGEALQDCAVDAWRIESAQSEAELDILTSAYSLAYRVAIILTASVILYMAQAIGWPRSYAIFAALVLVGVAGALFAREPLRAVAAAARARARFDPRRALDAVVQPFLQFFGKLGWVALLVLAVVTTYHLCDYLRGPV
ncbi:MAG: MFS transporter, partial [Caulobacteraceae bacterium]|nr:MFS transporter [Caulobacter sp.]